MAFPTWLIIVVVLLIILVILFRTMNQVYILSLIKNNFFWFFAIAILVFLAISLTHMHSTYDIDLTSSDGITAASKIYFSWLENVFTNLGNVVGYATEQSWFNTTDTISSN